MNDPSTYATSERRLAILCSEFPPGPGGIGTHAHQLATELTAIGWRVLVVTVQSYMSDAEVDGFNADQPFEVVRLRGEGAALKVPKRLHAMGRAIARFRPDVLLTSGARFAWTGVVMAARFRVPWVAVGHGSEFVASGDLRGLLTRLAFNRADAVVCVSEFTRARMLAVGVKPRAGAVIPNGADHNAFRPLPSAEVDAIRARMSHDRVLLTVGNVTERKGQEVVIRALPEVLRRFPRTRYLMAGLPSRGAELTDLAKRLGVAEQVRFLGRVPLGELVGLVNVCDVFLMTSRYTAEGDCEGFGIAVIEAALCGKPAVVSANSGLVEAVEDGRTGLVVPEGDVAATARAICDLLEHDDDRRRMGEAARLRALSDFTWRRKAAEYDGVLRRLRRA
jgi:phosphatidyl-myo-inositol dimannoside synthase